MHKIFYVFTYRTNIRLVSKGYESILLRAAQNKGDLSNRTFLENFERR